MIQLPKQLSRENPKAHKNKFGHVLILAGSRNMVGAAALCSLAAIRSGAGLVTLGIPKSLNLTAHRKISPVIMTFPLKETKESTLSLAAFNQIKEQLSAFDVLALGPGLSRNCATQRFICKVIETIPKPMIIDADALNAIAENPKILLKNKTAKVLTPHPGEMARLTRHKKSFIENNRKQIAVEFSKKYHCTLILKGHHSIVASSTGRFYINKTGNVGMATAGSGDVLTGMVSAFLAQGLSDFDAAKYATYIHGLAGDIAAQKKTQLSLIASDIIECIPQAFKRL